MKKIQMNISELVFDGHYKKLKLGAGIDEFKDKKHLIDQYYKNGRSVGCQLFYEQLVFDIGNDENGKIIYFILNFNKQSEELLITMKEEVFDLVKMNIELFFKILNNNQINWTFDYCWDKLIKVNLNNMSTITFSFYLEENGCQMIQIADKEKIELMKNKQFNKSSGK